MKAPKHKVLPSTLGALANLLVVLSIFRVLLNFFENAL